MFKNSDSLNNLRHSAAHLLAAAVLKLYPKAKHTIGPAIENGFYFDFDFGDQKISDTDLPKIEKKMLELIKGWYKFERHELSADKAKAEYPENIYKHELIDDIVKNGDGPITFYKSGDYWDLCEGGHTENPQVDLKFFKLLNIAGAYWRGSEKNRMLTRIYGTAFPSQEELDKYLNMLEEARQRDHRKLGKELELFAVPEEIGPGLFIWLPNGETVINEIQNYQRQLQLGRGYKHVKSPHIGKKELWVKSGHWDLYRDKMYSPMEIDGVEYLVKPMSCPMHIMVYKSKPHSYKDLPLKLAEVASVYRYEQSGELSGISRVRYFNQDDAHIFCTPEQLQDEFLSTFDLLEELYKPFGLTDLEFWFTTRSEEKKDKYLGSDEVWAKAEGAIKAALEKKGSPYKLAPGEAKFYGPSIDVMIKDSLGRKWQCGTIQVDFALPERFGLDYTGADGESHTPVMIHRAPFGSLERFMSIIIEHFAGAFPTWLAPIQTEILPISDKNIDYAKKVLERLEKASIRAEINSRSETLQAKIRDSQLKKVPYMLILGGREEENGTVALRLRDGRDMGAVKLEEFIEQAGRAIEEKTGLW